MSKGDTHKGIPTTYKGIEMRSKLETKVVIFLDALKMKWKYEPKHFLLSNGIPYVPDLYLPEHKIWIEVKGVIKKHNREISKIFVQDNHTTLILISADKIWWYSYKNGDYEDEGYKDNAANEDDGIQIGFCPSCKSYFFTGLYGSWHCRKCGYYDGDHPIFATINSWGGRDINFSDLDSILSWLDSYKIKTGENDIISKV